MSDLACVALSALRRVMAVISSREDDVSSIADACSDDPSARDWPAEATSSEAVETWSAAVYSPSVILLMGEITERTIK